MKQLSTAEILERLSNKDSREELINSWPHTKCSTCKHASATGIWLCRVASFSHPYFIATLRPLCAGCGLGHSFLQCDLFLQLSAPKGDDRTYADKLIEKLLTHPSGEMALRAWKLMYKPANIHHPIQPAELMLEALVEKFFPPQTNKAD